MAFNTKSATAKKHLQETSDNIVQKRQIPQRHACASKNLKAPMRRTRGVSVGLSFTVFSLWKLVFFSKILSEIFHNYILVMECLLFQPHPHKKNSYRMLEGEKNNMQAHTPRKKIHCELRVEKKFTTRPNHPAPLPLSEVKWSAP